MLTINKQKPRCHNQRQHRNNGQNYQKTLPTGLLGNSTSYDIKHDRGAIPTGIDKPDQNATMFSTELDREHAHGKIVGRWDCHAQYENRDNCQNNACPGVDAQAGQKQKESDTLTLKR